MDSLVTGAAGFIGSHLAEALLGDGGHVRCVDSFTPYYDRTSKEANLVGLRRARGARFIEADLGTANLDALLDDVDVVYHLAGQPGVRLSWGHGFASYERENVLVTQRLLEAIRRSGRQIRLVFSSSSSVYGNAPVYPCDESTLPRPHSPYGVTKLAAEHLCNLYARNWGVATVSLRYFTVYGPRQRPDMATHRLVEAGLSGEPFPLFGTGDQRRDFTYVGDVVAANLAAGRVEVEPGTVLNVAGGAEVSMNELIDHVSDLLGRPIPIDRQEAKPGDVVRTGASTERAREVLGWAPAMSLVEGLANQVSWHRSRRAA